MKWLDQEETDAWFLINGVKRPNLEEFESVYYTQCEAPTTCIGIENFLNVIFTKIMGDAPILIEFEDTSPSDDSKDFIFNSMRLQSGETEIRNKHARNAAVFDSDESHLLIAFFSVACCFKWKSCAYSSSKSLIFNNWEGEIFDFWTDSADILREIKNVVKGFELKLLE